MLKVKDVILNLMLKIWCYIKSYWYVSVYWKKYDRRSKRQKDIAKQKQKKSTKSCNKDKPSKYYYTYLDINNFYGWEMTQYLSTDGFK